jgi:hypothetical protein
MLVLIIMWLIRYFIYASQTGSHSDAYYALPSFHIKQLTEMIVKWFCAAVGFQHLEHSLEIRTKHKSCSGLVTN